MCPGEMGSVCALNVAPCYIYCNDGRYSPLCSAVTDGLEEALREIMRLAQEGQIIPTGKAPNQIDGLGYSPDDVCDAVWSAAANRDDWLAPAKYEKTVALAPTRSGRDVPSALPT